MYCRLSQGQCTCASGPLCGSGHVGGLVLLCGLAVSNFLNGNGWRAWSEVRQQTDSF